MQRVDGQLRSGEQRGVPWFGKTTKPRKEKRSPATAVQYIHAFCAFSHDQGRCQVALTAFHFFHEISSSQRAPTSTPLPAPQADFLIACRRFSFAPHASHQAGLGWAGLGWAFSSAGCSGSGPPLVTPSAALPCAMPSIPLFTGRDRNRKQAKKRKGLSRLRCAYWIRLDSMRVNESIRSENP